MKILVMIFMGIIMKVSVTLYTNDGVVYTYYHYLDKIIK
jgi:hypothetical protein